MYAFKGTKLPQASLPDFCVAPWSHGGFDLSRGLVRSCCHHDYTAWDATNLNPGDSLSESPVAIKVREEMLTGVRPNACGDCWKVEDGGGVSNRQTWAAEHVMRFDRASVLEAKSTRGLVPAWVEIMFSNLCNFRCSYCNSFYSSSWAKSIERGGPYPGRAENLEFADLRSRAPQIEALRERFLPWIESALGRIRILKVSGGEPLLQPETFELIELLLRRRPRDLAFGLNTNLCPPEASWRRFLELATRLKSEDAVIDAHICASIDSWGKRAEYIRSGLKVEVLAARVEEFIERTAAGLIFNCTVNNLCLGGFEDLLRFVLKVKRINSIANRRVSVSINVLSGPSYMDLQLRRPEEGRELLDSALQFAEENAASSWSGFTPLELNSLRSLRGMLGRRSEDQLRLAEFFEFFREYDRREGKKFTEVFPELNQFWRRAEAAFHERRSERKTEVGIGAGA